jgi:hypothetical protein
LDEPLHRWVIAADSTEQGRLRAYQRRSIGDQMRSRWQSEREVASPEKRDGDVTRDREERM